MREDRFTRIDESAAPEQTREEAARLRRILAEMDANAHRIGPPTDGIYRRCLAQPISRSAFAAKLPT